jgi:hypothetical protein
VLLNSNINQQSIYSHFPASQSIPSRLIELLDWLSVVIYDEIGSFPQFTGNSLDRYFPDLKLSPYFGSFAQLEDGSLLAYWFYEGGDRLQPPIVMISAEGDLEVIANSIEEWVARLIDGKFPAHWADRMDQFYIYANGIWVEALRLWAEANWDLTSAKRSQLTTSQPQAKHPNIRSWYLNQLRLV